MFVGRLCGLVIFIDGLAEFRLCGFEPGSEPVGSDPFVPAGCLFLGFWWFWPLSLAFSFGATCRVALWLGDFYCWVGCV